MTAGASGSDERAAPLIETPRLALRLVRPADSVFICELLNDPGFIRNIGDRGVRTPEDAVGYLGEKLAPSYDQHGYGLYVVERRDTGEALGICGFVKRSYLEHADVGFAFLERHTSRGFGLESASAVLSYGQWQLGLPRVLGITSRENAASVGLLGRLGLAFERPVDIPGMEEPRLLFSLSFPAVDTPEGAVPGLPPAPKGYPARMPRQAEALRLESVGADAAGRPVLLAPRAAAAWRSLSAAASADGLNPVLVSGFRSFERQRAIVAAKLGRGEPLEAILAASAYPGFSEHHTGRAVDIGGPGSSDLTERFESNREFSWLVRHAARFGFRITYPRGNAHGIAFEPWHWCHDPGLAPGDGQT